MPAKGQGAADEWYVVDRWGVGNRWGPDPVADDADVGDGADGGAVWVAYPDEGMHRASAALASGGDVWAVDPVDTPQLDELLDEMGELRGVAVLLNRHWRDADDVADRHDVPVYAPDWFDDPPELDAELHRFGDRLPETDLRARRLVNMGFWQEAALFDGETLVVPEALGTAPYFAQGSYDLGVHPVLAVWPPRDSLGGLGPDRVVVGHGDPVTEDATAALEDALAGARRNAPGALVTMLSGMLRG